MKRILQTLAAGALLLAAAMPAAAAKAHMTGWLQDYHRLGHIGGVPIEQVWLHPEFDIRDFRTLYIAPVQIDPAAYSRRGAEDRAMAQRLGAALRLELLQQLQSAGIFTFVTDDPYFRNSRKGGLTLELRITQIYSGNAKSRSFIGLGAGATEVQIEGKLYDTASCRTFVELADRRMHTGSSLITGQAATRDAEYLIGIDMKQIMRGIVKLFIYMREEGPLYNQR